MEFDPSYNSKRKRNADTLGLYAPCERIKLLEIIIYKIPNRRQSVKYRLNSGGFYK